jgi:pSer/pThr/pTyr-binding forkhead associated (FHA) protein
MAAGDPPTVETIDDFTARIEGLEADDFARVFDHPFLIEVGGKATDEEPQRGATLPPGAGNAPFDPSCARVVSVRKITPVESFRHITIGRTPNNDIHLDDRSVSKLHCYLQAPGAGRETWSVVDMSTYGVMVGAKKLTRDEPFALPKESAPGTEPRFQIGDLKFLWYQDPKVALAAVLQRG